MILYFKLILALPNEKSQSRFSLQVISQYNSLLQITYLVNTHNETIFPNLETETTEHK